MATPHCIRLSVLYLYSRNHKQDSYKEKTKLLIEHDKIKTELMFKVAEYNLLFLDAGGNRVVKYSPSQIHSLIGLPGIIKDLSVSLDKIVPKIIKFKTKTIRNQLSPADVMFGWNQIYIKL